MSQVVIENTDLSMSNTKGEGVFLGARKLTRVRLLVPVSLALLMMACGDQITVLGTQEGGGFSDDDAVLGQGGGALTEACRDCVSDVEEDDCSHAAERCRDSEACGLYLKCQKHCGWAKICDDACSAQFPAGKQAFEALPDCYVCAPCSGDCADWWVYAEYCEASP